MKKWIPGLTVAVITILCIGISGSYTRISCQDDSPNPAKARLSLSYQNINNIGPRLIASVKTKIGRSYAGVPALKLYFTLLDTSGWLDIGHSTTGENGETVFMLPESLTKILNKQDTFHYRVTLPKNNSYYEANDEAVITRTACKLFMTELDSIKTVKFTIIAPDSLGYENPVKGVEVGFYSQRMFGLLPLHDKFKRTNEVGEIEFDFPDNIPGDMDGKLKLVAKIEDHEKYGTLTTIGEIDWGIPNVPNPELDKRALWASRTNAPLYLVIWVNGMVLGIWGTLAVIILKLYRIKNLSLKQID